MVDAFKLLLQRRRDERHFDASRAVSKETVESLIRQACLAPSVGFSQPWRFVIVNDPDRRRLVQESFERCNHEALQSYEGAEAAEYARLKLAGLREAPVQLAVFTELDAVRGKGLGRRTMPQTLEYSTVMAIHTLWLAATAQGLAMGWVSILDPQVVQEALMVPSRWKLTAYLCLGYSKGWHAKPELEREGWEARAPLDEVLFER